jgi:hypothetical protein
MPLLQGRECGRHVVIGIEREIGFEHCLIARRTDRSLGGELERVAGDLQKSAWKQVPGAMSIPALRAPQPGEGVG